MEKWFLPGYLVVNIIVFILYGVDKYKARHKRWRTPESTLLVGAVLGVFGALAGMHFFRHKTKKMKFSVTVLAILGLELMLAVGVCLYLL